MQDRTGEGYALEEFEDALAAALGLVVPPHDAGPHERADDPFDVDVAPGGRLRSELPE